MGHLPEGWGVVSDDDQLSLALSQCLQGLFVAKHKLATLHHQSQARVDVLDVLLLQYKYVDAWDVVSQQSVKSTSVHWFISGILTLQAIEILIQARINHSMNNKK